MGENTEIRHNRKKEQEEALRVRREERRRRRKRNQALAYLFSSLFIILIVVSVVMTVLYIGKQEKIRAANNPSMPDDLRNIIGTEESLVKPDPTDAAKPQSKEEMLDEIINAAIEVMPIEDKVAGLFIVTPESITGVKTAVQAGEGTKEALAKWAVGGLIYFGDNLKTKEQITEMISNTSLYSRYPLFIGIDEEGGSASRIAEAGFAENVGSAQSIGETADPTKAYAAGESIAGYLKELGFNLNFAPVADINSIEDSMIGDRSYGSDSSVVASMSSSMVQGLEDNGVSACLKHFPGIGSSVEDTHVGMSDTDRSAEQFRGEEFVVFKTGIDAGVDFVMVSHLSVPALTGDNTPSTLSKAVVTDILRDELGFKGIIITDAMKMGAITVYYEADEAAILALKAGCDMILMPDDFEKAYNGVLEAVQNGKISEARIDDSLRRIYRIKYADKLDD